MTVRQETMMPRLPAETCWHVSADGPARTTHAGRLALPVTVRLGEHVVAVIDLVLDGNRAAQLYAALGEHLAGRAVAGAAR
jgi:hypothetical protein